MNEERRAFFDEPRNIRWMLRVFYVFCVALFSLDLIWHRHITHSWEAWWGFYALYGFVACVVLVLLAKELRKLVMRSENYFDDD